MHEVNPTGCVIAGGNCIVLKKVELNARWFKKPNSTDDYDLDYGYDNDIDR